MNKKVSVIIPTKNSASTLRDCLVSVLNQEYKNVEIIVVDNYSSDRTPEIAKKYSDLFFQKGPERSWQRNYASEKATGKYILVIDSDMVLSNNVISECVAEMSKSTKYNSIVIPEESFGEGFWSQCKKLERSFYIGVGYMEAARFFRLADFRAAGGYNVEMVSGEDWDLSQRIAKKGKITRVNSLIYHNEGKITLYKTIKKKYYYAKKFQKYATENKGEKSLNNQINVFNRYKLFFIHPIKLFKNPFVGVGMLFMKTCEFMFGSAGYLVAKFSGRND